MLLIVRDNNAVICFSDCCDDHVNCTPWSSSLRPFCHDFSPDKRRIVVEWENSTGKESLRSLRASEPTLQLLPFLSGWSFQHAAPNFCDCQSGNK